MEAREQISIKTNGIFSALCKAQAMLNPADKDSVAGAGVININMLTLQLLWGLRRKH